MDDMAKLALLRVQLFTAAAQLKGPALEEFWSMIDDLVKVRPALQGPHA